VSRNIIFDEASSWWSAEAILLPDSKEIKESTRVVGGTIRNVERSFNTRRDCSC